LPTYDEALNIEEALRRIRHKAPSVDVLVIDDHSPDGTADLARTVGAELGRMDVLDRPAKRGLGEAYRAGFTQGLAEGYEVLIQMDADLSHDAASLPDLLAALDAGADVVIGSRYVEGGSIPHWPPHRRALSRYGNWYSSRMLGLGVHDATSGFRAIRAQMLRKIDFQSTRCNGYGFQIEQTYRLARVGADIREVPISFTDRVRGNSKMSMAIIAEAMFLVTRWGIRDRVMPSRGWKPPA
jgi:dolichol-phosphate mannosyltransferase